MTDRDTFAAAALTGLLAAPTDKDRSSEYWARFSYEIADAMLRERGNHPARPDSSALTDAEREAVRFAMYRCDGPEYKTLRKLLERLR